MTYEQRIALIRRWFLADITTRFSMPNGVDPKVAATDIIEGINSNTPSQLTAEQIGNLLASITKEIARSAKSRTLPTTKDFIDATKAASQTRSQALGTTTTQNTSMDPLRLAAARIRTGQPVGEDWIKGNRRELLIKQCGITEDQLAPYDLYIAAHMQ